MTPDKEMILSEILRLAEQSGGRSPDQAAFAKATRIGVHEWKGVFWRRWSEAQAEAGLAEAKFWLEPRLELAENYGLSKRRLNTALRTIQDHKGEILATWRRHFGR